VPEPLLPPPLPPLPLIRADGRPLRVAHLTTVDMSLALLLGTELAYDVECGFEVFGLSAPGPYVERIEKLGVVHRPLTSLTRSWDPRRDVRAAGELRAALTQLRPDVLHTHNPKTGVIGRVLGRAARVPVVVNTCHGLWVRPDDSWRKKVVVVGMEAVAAKFSHAELYQNAVDRDTLRRFVPARRSRVVGNGVDLARFAFDADGRAKLRAEWGVAAGDLVIGGVGRRVAEKGIREFATAARELSSRARFVWVGPDDTDKADAVGDLAGVDFVGAYDNMPAVYSAFDVFVLPSYREGFSRSGMEAAACGRPMVLTDIRGCREVGRDGEHLLLVPPAEVKPLVAAIEKYLDDEVLRDRLAGAAHKRAQQEFDQRRVAQISVQTYEAVACKRNLGWRTA
jgi:glycosyltransferase involved in cell wall biosynthesis